MVPTRKRVDERLKSSMLAVEENRGGRGGGEFRLDKEPGGSGYGEEAKASFASVSMGVGIGERVNEATNRYSGHLAGNADHLAS